VTGITHWALRHKRLVIGFWLVLTILGMAFSRKAADALSQEYSLPGHQSYETNTQITSKYGGGG
jgi:RND superfamily putative drug exporter